MVPRLSEPDREQVRTFLNVRTGRLSNRDLVNHAQDRLAEPNPPPWVVELACLDPSEVPDAHDVLKRQLLRAGILPDSDFLRSEIRVAVAQWAWRVAATGDDRSSHTSKPETLQLLELCRDYRLDDVSRPIEEFYDEEVYYSSRGPHFESAGELARYILAHLHELVPQMMPDSPQPPGGAPPSP